MYISIDNFQVLLRFWGENHALLTWPDKMEDEIIDCVISFSKYLKNSGLYLEVVPAYNSIGIAYSEKCTQSDIFRELRSITDHWSQEKKENTDTVEVPVCYSSKFSPDLENVLKDKNLTLKELIQLHTSPMYKVCFIGFLPGFLYLSGLKESLFMSRKATPAVRVSEGAVGIGGKQTGIYPYATPAGWNIIGQCPLNLFDLNRKDYTIALPGQYLKFYSISEAEFHKIKD